MAVLTGFGRVSWGLNWDQLHTQFRRSHDHISIQGCILGAALRAGKASRAHISNTGEGMRSLLLPRASSWVKPVAMSSWWPLPTFHTLWPALTISQPPPPPLRPAPPQYALSCQQGLSLAWRWPIWLISGYIGGRYHNNNTEKIQLKMIPKISGNFFLTKSFMIWTIGLLTPLGWDQIDHSESPLVPSCDLIKTTH